MKSPQALRPGELVFSLALLGFGLFAFYEAYAISGLTGLTTGGVLPMLAASVMIASGLVIVRGSLARRGAERHGLARIATYLLPLRLILFSALLALYAASIPWIGFMAASASFLFVAILALWRRGPLWTAAITAASSLSIYVIFRLVFQVVLPAGSLWQ